MNLARRRLGRSTGIVGGGIKFSPIDLKDLLFWVDFSDKSTLYQDAARTIPVTASGQYIYGAKDRSPTGANMSTTLPFVYMTGVKNGKAGARIGKVAKLNSVGFNKNQPITVYLVANVTDGNTYKNIIGGTTKNSIVYINNGKPGYYAGALKAGTSTVNSNYMLLQATFNGASSVLKLNDIIETSVNPGANGLSEISIGGTTMSGYINEILITSAAHTKIYNYLYSKYGMSDVTPPAFVGRVTDEAGITDGKCSGVYIDNGCCYFDNSNDNVINILSDAMKAKFDGNNASIIVKTKPPAGFWADTNARDLFRFDGPSTTIFAVDKQVNQLRPWYNTRTIMSQDMSAITDFYTIAMTIRQSTDYFHAYINAVDQGAYSGGALPAFQHPLTEAYIGATTNSQSRIQINWWGWIADVVIPYGVTATAEQISTLHTALMAGTLDAATLNTMFGAGNWSWLKNNTITY